MNKSIPICFIHSGFSQHLLLAIRQAKHHNPDSELFLLGDKENQHLDKFCTHVLAKDNSTKIDAFSKVYRHFSTNSFHFEFICFKRWFQLLEFMQQENLDWVCTMDSDFMLYSPAEEYYKTRVATEFEAGFCIPIQDYNLLRWTASGHIAFVSRSFLISFCDFVIETYTYQLAFLEGKIKYHRENNIAGGICDMTLLYLYYRNNPERIANLLIPFDGYVFDHNFNSAENLYQSEFEKKGAYKWIILENGKPYGFTTDGNKVFFHGLHFQGDAKKEMISYYFDRVEVMKHKMKAFQKKIVNKVKRTITK